MTRRQRIDSAREARLWIGQVIVPTVGLVVTAANIPAVRQTAVKAANKVKLKATDIKRSVERKFKH